MLVPEAEATTTCCQFNELGATLKFVAGFVLVTLVAASLNRTTKLWIVRVSHKSFVSSNNNNNNNQEKTSGSKKLEPLVLFWFILCIE